MTTWQDIETAKPDGSRRLIARGNPRSVSIGSWYGGKRWSVEGHAVGFAAEDVVAWAELPPPPNTGADK